MSETAPTTSPISDDKFAIIEIMGHDRIAGKVSESAFGGTTFVCVDTPDLPAIPAETRDGSTVYDKVYRRRHGGADARLGYRRLLGGSAIFSIRFCTEAESIADELRRQALRPAPSLDFPQIPGFDDALDAEFHDHDVEEYGVGE